MLLAVGSMTALGVTFGVLLGIAAIYLAVEADPLEAEIQSLLPGSQCGQCGFIGCGQAAAALARGEASVNLCPPGGMAVAEKLAKKLGVSLDPNAVVEEKGPEFAFIKEELCIGCMRCQQECSTDAIIGANKQMHTVVTEACHGCSKCSKVCPTEAIIMNPVKTTLATWHWDKPQAGQSIH